MSRLLLQTAANATIAVPSPQSTSKSGMIYTFAFIGATLVVGLAFLAVMFKYVLKYRHWRAPVTDPLQPGGVKEEECRLEFPPIKEVVVISNPDGVPGVSIIREDEMSDKRPKFLVYETMISKKALDNYSQIRLTTPMQQNMRHAASASDLAGMGASYTKTGSMPKRIDEGDSG